MGIGLSFAFCAIVAAGCAVAGQGATPFEEEVSSDAGHVDARTTSHDAGRSYEASTYDAPPPPPEDASQPDTNISPPPPMCNDARLLTGIPACDQCLEANCCAPDETCSTSQDCMDFVQCGNDCFNADGGPTQACFDACTTAHPTGAQQMSALDSCISSSCGTACGM
jgi:hypothetical protein